MTRVAPPRVAVLGAGPVGLEAAAYVVAAGLPVTVYDAGPVAATVERWGFVKLFSQFGMNASPLGKQLILREVSNHSFPADADLLTGREYREAYLVPLARSAALAPHVVPETRVLAVGRGGWRKSDPSTRRLPPFRLLLRDARGERFEAADIVFDCTGTLSRPNWVGDGGIPAAGELAARPHVVSGVDDILGSRKGFYAGKTVLVVGSGYSAATVVTDLTALAEEQQATWVVWLTRGPKTAPLPRLANDPLKERDRLAARANHLAGRCDGNLEYHAHAQIDELLCHGPDKGFRVAGRVAGKPAEWDVERVIAAVGTRPDLALCAELRVDEPAGDIETDEPGYFVLGSKALGRDSDFLIRDGFDHIRRAVAAVAGRPGLDLYRAAAGRAA